VAPPSQAAPVLRTQIAELTATQAALIAEAADLERSLPLLNAELSAIRETPGAESYRGRRAAELAEDQSKLAGLRSESVQVGVTIRAANRELAALEAGEQGDPRVHLHHAAEPQPQVQIKRRALAEAWADLSVGLLIAALAIIVWLHILPPVLAVVALFGSYLAVEAFLGRRTQILVLRLSLILAILSAAILVVTYLREVFLLGLLGLGLLLIADNIGELRRRIS
jgi:hypothetical protein